MDLATHRPEKASMFWWDVIRASTNGPNMPWDQFRVLFEILFFHEAEREAMIKEFEHLNQGSKTIIEYVTRFNELRRYHTHLVDTRRRKNVKFNNGISHYITKSLIPFLDDPFERVLDLAIQYKKNENSFHEARNKTKIMRVPRMSSKNLVIEIETNLALQPKL